MRSLKYFLLVLLLLIASTSYTRGIKSRRSTPHLTTPPRAATVEPKGCFRRSHVCVIHGSWSLWAGLTEEEANKLDWAAGRGYGNDWDVSAQKTFQYSGGPVTLAYDYAVEAEAGFDYAYVLIDTTGVGAVGDVVLHVYSWGADSGHQVKTLTPGINLPQGPYPKTVVLKFRAISDLNYSDEDGLYPTDCGLGAFDDISLQGGINDYSDFETGSDDWTETCIQPLPCSIMGDTTASVGVTKTYSTNTDSTYTRQWSVASLPPGIASISGLSTGGSVQIHFTGAGVATLSLDVSAPGDPAQNHMICAREVPVYPQPTPVTSATWSSIKVLYR